MIKTVLATIAIIVLYLCFCLIIYSSFYGAFRDDIAELFGSKTLKHTRKQYKGFWVKFLFLDFFRYVKRSHYILFLLWLLSCCCAVLLFCLRMILDSSCFDIPLYLAVALNILCGFISCFIRWKLYKFNITRPKPPHRRSPEAARAREELRKSIEKRKEKEVRRHQ